MKRIVFALFLLVSVVRFIFAEQNEFVLDNFKYKIVDGQVNVCGPTNQNIFELHIPNDIDGQVVAIIEENAFKDCINLTNVVLPNRLMQIKNRAFYNCRMLKKINIPDNVIYIGYGAFGNCYSLQNVKLPKMLGSIGMELFRNCRSLTKCEIPEGVVSISDYAFAGCKNLDVIVLPRSLMECSKNAFIDTNVRLETTNICWQNREYDYSAMIQVNTQNVTVCGSGDIGVFVNGSNNVLPPFQIGKFPVTEDFYNSIMGIEINSANVDLSNDDEILQYRPVKDMSFYKAIAFCNKLSLKLGLLPVYQIEGFDYDDWADFSADDIPTEYDCKWNNATCDYTCDGYRLPNEAELEFAFRGANQNDKNWNCFAEVINTSGTQKIRQVGLGSHNKLGLHDYLGNVLQLCNDNFDEVKKGLYFNRHIHNESGTKVALGGSAAKKTVLCRMSLMSNQSESYVGFRLARSVYPVDSNIVTFHEEVFDDASIDVVEKEQNENFSIVRFCESVTPKNPKDKPGYFFVGWCSDKDGKSLFDFNNNIVEDVDLFAKYHSQTNRIVAPKMVNIIGRDQSPVVLDNSLDNITLQGYQLSKNLVSQELFESVMGYCPNVDYIDCSTDENACVLNVSCYEAITFCNKLSLRAGKKCCYSVADISPTKWLDLSVDLVRNGDVSWNVCFDASSDGYRLPTKLELMYAFGIIETKSDESDDVAQITNFNINDTDCGVGVICFDNKDVSFFDKNNFINTESAAKNKKIGIRLARKVR